MLKKIKKEDWLYIFILINPIFDLLSSLFTNNNFTYTPSTFLRPLLPLIFVIYIFFKDREMCKKLLFLIPVYIAYISGHILIYKNLITAVSFGTVSHELQYLFNYTYLIFTFLIYIYVFYKKENKLKDYLFYYTCFYIGTIYIAIITNTSYSSYVEGTGYKGWFNTSGAVGAILIISLFILVPYLFKKQIKFIYKFLFLFLTMFYLCFLIGSRTGLFGSILVVGSYVIATIFYYFMHNKKINIRKYLPFIIGGSILFVIAFVVFGSYTIERRKQLEEMADDKIHIAYDLLDIKNGIEDGTIDDTYMSKEQIRALNSMYDYANKIKLPNVDLRSQQLIYHYYLYQYQDDILLKVFGNGYLTNFGALTLEMEGIALFFNFGIIGFVLYCVPFLSIFIYGLFIGIKNVKKIDIEYIMYLMGIFGSYLISTLAGHVYFNTSVMPVIIIIHLLLLNKIYELKEQY